MKNKNVGYLIIGLAIVLGIIVFIFNNALTTIVNTTCPHGPSCSMYGTIKTQTYIGGALIGLIILIGLFFVFAKEETKIITKTKRVEVEAKRKPIDYFKLDNEEKIIAKSLEDADGTMFQSDLVEKSDLIRLRLQEFLID